MICRRMETFLGSSDDTEREVQKSECSRIWLSLSVWIMVIVVSLGTKRSSSSIGKEDK